MIDRCNLTVLYEEGQEDLASFLAENKVKNETLARIYPKYGFRGFIIGVTYY